MKKFGLFAAAVAVATVALASPAAAVPMIDYTPNVGGTFGNDDPSLFPPLFTDTYEFITSFERTAEVEITSFMTAGDFSTNVNFVSNGVKLDTTVIPATSTGQNERRYLANFRLPAGTHNIIVKGSSGENGMYSGLLSLSGVPEPSTWAMMILGLGLAGAALRRRKQTVRVAFG